ncbi:MAG: hypothetical protein ABT940_12385, partial [Alphaproteobacteria bacterium]
RNTAGDLIIRDVNDRQTFIANYQGGPGAAFDTAGIYVGEVSSDAFRLFDPDFPSVNRMLDAQMELVEALWKANMGQDVRMGGVDPLVIDLDGDGLELSPRTAASPWFDMDGDGFAERTGWVHADDGVVAMDLNGNGAIDDVRELFGGPDKSVLTELAARDDNQDGRIDAGDAVYGDLKVWTDRDGDAVTDAGELTGLAQAGIAAIALAGTPAASGTLISGNQIAATTHVVRTDGTTAEAAEVLFGMDNFQSRYLGDTTIGTDAALLPEVKGHGTLTDLRVAMTLDPGLAEAVRANLPALSMVDLAELREAATPILAAWARAVTLPDENGVPAVVEPGAHADIPIGLDRDATIFEDVVNNSRRIIDAGNPDDIRPFSIISRAHCAMILQSSGQCVLLA